MYRKAKRDKNEPDIINTARAMGATVVQLDDPGVPDLLLGVNGVNYLVEVKSDKGELTPGQIAFFNNWNGQKIVIRTSEEMQEFILSNQDIAILTAAKEANPHWYHALIDAAKIMTERRKKYAGKYHPYFNFVDMAYRIGTSITQVFKFYLNIKASRLSTTEEDYADEKVLDTWIDVANYALIAAGWHIDNLNTNSVAPKDTWEQNQFPLSKEMLEQTIQDLTEILNANFK